MSWVEIDENLYQNDIAPYFLQKIESQWYVVDSRDKSKFISFLDIFSNPVFPSGGTYPDLDFIVKNLIALNNITATNLIQALNINTTDLTVSNLIQALNITATNLIQALNINTTNLTVSSLIQALNITATNLIQALNINTTDLTVSNLIQALNITATGTIRANHFRGESSNTPSTPAFSSQGDPNTGFYHITEGIFGFSSNGVQQGEFGNGYGGFRGNILQTVNSKNTHQYTVTNQPIIPDVDLLTFISGIGATTWITQITPKKTNSNFIINYRITSSRSVICGYVFYYRVNLGSWILFYQSGQNAGNVPVEIPAITAPIHISTFLQNPIYNLGDTLDFKVSMRTSSATNTFSFGIGSLIRSASECTIQEIYG